jgi:hypothetical protein
MPGERNGAGNGTDRSTGKFRSIRNRGDESAERWDNRRSMAGGIDNDRWRWRRARTRVETRMKGEGNEASGISEFRKVE